jgi:predicted dehydrogenase
MTVLKWGLTGAGDIARKRIAPALRSLPNCELVSVSRGRADLAEAFAREFGAPKWFADWRGQIADPGIDAVYIATPVYLHAGQAIAAAEAGKHVLCEKPMALNSADCDRMISACRANNVKLGIAYYRRFYPVLRRAKEIIEAGELGNITLAQINAFEYVDLEENDPRHWFLEKEKSGGGPMMDFGCHRIEVLTGLFGTAGRVTSLVSYCAFGREVEDTAIANILFESGTCGTVTVTHAAIEPKDTLDIYGTEGSIHIPVLNLGEITIASGGSNRTESHPPHANFHQPLIEEFTAAVLDDGEPLVGGETGRDVQGVIEEIYNDGR